jgi:hypothetical protein
MSIINNDIKININNEDTIHLENEKKIQNSKHRLENLEKNIMRHFCSITNPILKQTIGSYYFIIHIVLIALGCIILLFTQNIWYLLIILNIIFLDGVAMLSYHECPLTILEQKYLNTNMSKQSKTNLNDLPIHHQCDHVYETQFELIINLCTLTIVKIFTIILMKSFHYTFI